MPEGSVFVGIGGLGRGSASYSPLPGLYYFRPVTNAPGVVSVTAAAHPDTDWMGVGRYAPGLAAELVVWDPDRSTPHGNLLQMAWHVAALLKLRGHETLYCPAAATCSWDLVCLRRDRSVRFFILDDVPRQLRTVDPPRAVSGDDLAWVFQHSTAALDLRDFASSRRFGLAFNLAYTYNHTSDVRVALASVWAGLDALFGKKEDLRSPGIAKALALRISAWLGDIEESEVRSLYELRCDAIHGRWLADEDPECWQGLHGSASLLRRSLIRAIESARPTLPDWRS